LDCLVNNAGIGRAQTAADTSDEDWDRFIAVNQTSVFRMSREALTVLPPGRGTIVNIASIAAIVGLTGAFSYVASKSAVLGMTRQLATDYGPRGIRVNAIAPGQIETPLTADRISGDPRFVAFNVDPIPFPRLGRPEDIANAVFFLASDQASYINGHTLVVDGGWTISSFSRRGYEM
jgi:NAD(P)-dependent dehydrogenase (short-subunit alcohol dehydrogenase family)